MDEYILRSETLKHKRLMEAFDWNGNFRATAVLVKDILKIPTADVVPIRHGRWDIDGVYVVCSVCNRPTLSPIVKQLPTFKYCPNCGARMNDI